MKAEEIDEKFDAGEAVTQCLDLTKSRRPGREVRNATEAMQREGDHDRPSPRIETVGTLLRSYQRPSKNSYEAEGNPCQRSGSHSPGTPTAERRCLSCRHSTSAS